MTGNDPKQQFLHAFIDGAEPGWDASVRHDAHEKVRSIFEQLEVSRLGEKAWADLMNWAWTIICNVSEGDWTKQNQDWQDAAAKCREQYHAMLASNPASEPNQDSAPNTGTEPEA